jgi:hypothetical protein
VALEISTHHACLPVASAQACHLHAGGPLLSAEHRAAAAQRSSRSGRSLWADRWLFEQLPELRGLQAAVLQGQVPQNVPCLNAEVDKMSPAAVVKASRT